MKKLILLSLISFFATFSLHADDKLDYNEDSGYYCTDPTDPDVAEIQVEAMSPSDEPVTEDRLYDLEKAWEKKYQESKNKKSK